MPLGWHRDPLGGRKGGWRWGGGGLEKLEITPLTLINQTKSLSIPSASQVLGDSVCGGHF